MADEKLQKLYGGVVGTGALNLGKAESARVEPPAFETLEEFFVWQRELYRPGAAPPPGREVVVELRGKQLELVVYSLPPLKIITPFGSLLLIAKPDAGD